MGVTFYLLAVPPPVVDALRLHPAVIDIVQEVRGDMDELRACATEFDDHDLAAFVGLPRLAEVEQCISDEVNIDKAWAGIHFLLTGQPDVGYQPGATPLEWALRGGAAAIAGAPVVEPRVVDADQVADLVRALTPIDLEARFDPDALERADVYPENLWHQDDALEYLTEHYEALVAFYQGAWERGDAVLICTTV